LPEFNYTDLLGKEFEYGGRGPDAFDCWGLCLEVTKRAGVVLPRVYTPAEFAAMNDLFDSTKGGDYIKINKPEPFCIAVFRMRPPIIWHAAVVLPDCHRFIHIMQRRSVTIDRLDSPVWERKLDGFYVFDGLLSE